MTERISDSTLGSRFWYDSNPSVSAKSGASPAVKTSMKDVKHDSTITTFVKAGGDPMAQSAISKAELFAASHTISAEARQVANQKADNNLRELIGSAEDVDAFINKTAANYVKLHEGFSLDDAKELCRNALRKLAVTREFDERANIPIAHPQLAPVGARKLKANGLMALKNAVIGLATMLREGTISEDAVIVLADGDYYDAANRADLLRLVSSSAKKVKQLFIGEERFDALIRQCEDALRGLGDNVEPQRKAQLEEKLAHLKELKAAAIERRKVATDCIKTDYLLTDPTGKVKSDRKFQKQQIDAIRDSLRAFRYGLDCASGKSMGAMERMRRFFDQLRSDHKSGSLMNEAKLQAIRTADQAFNTCLNELRDSLLGAVPAGFFPQPKKDVYEKASVEVGRADMMDVAESMEAATKLSHLTNDRIRYHYSGVEKREAENYKAISDELGDIAENGGSRTVTFRAGVDALLGLDIAGLAVNVKAGAAVDIKAQIKVNDQNGTVNITYSVGGDLHAGATAKIGADPDAEIPQAGLGAKAEVSANFGVTRSVTKTYASLEEFAKTASRLNMVMTPRPREVFYAYGKAAVKGIGHLFMLGATAAGFRISRSKMDQVAYSAELRNRNVFGQIGGIFLKKRNVEVLSERTAWSVGGGLKGTIDAGLYFDTGDGSLGSNVEFGGSLSGDYSREVSAKGKVYQSFAKSLALCSEAYLQGVFDGEPSTDAGWKTVLRGILTEGAANEAPNISKALFKLSEKLTALEDSAIGKEQGDKEFWGEFAEKSRMLAVATAILTKRAEALDAEAEGAADAKKAAKAAVDDMVPRLANPVVKVPAKIFQEKFFDIFNVTTPRTSRLTGSFSVHVDLLGNFFDEKLDDLGIGDDAESFGAGLGNSVANAGIDIAKETIGLSNKLEVRVTKESVVSKHKDARPWLNNGKTSIDVRVSASLPMRIILDVVARHYVKSAGGLDELDESKWKQEFWDSLKDGLKTSAEDIAIDNAVPLMEMTLGDAVEKYPALGKLIGAVDFLKGKYDQDYAFKDDTLKTLHFEIGADGRFAGFTLAEDYDTEAKLDLSVGQYISVNFSLSSKTSVNDWSVIPKPTVNDLMKRASDYRATGNPEEFANFLARNKKGVIRLIQAGRTGAPARPKDKYWQKDVEKMNATFDGCTAILTELAGGNDKIAEQAKAIQASFPDLVDEVKGQAENLEPDAALDLAQRFFDVAAQIYTLKAMKG